MRNVDRMVRTERENGIMGRKLTEFHGIAADMLISAKRQHDGRGSLGPYLCQASQDAVTAWRRTAHVVSEYANGAAVRGIRPTWEAFWEDGIDRAGMLRLLTERSRFNRCQEGGEAELYDDSVKRWEYGLARGIMWTAELVETARRGGSDAGTIKRLELDHEVTVQLAVAYTGVSVADFRRIVNERAGENVMMAFACGPGKYAAHPMFDLIAANRPTV